MCLVYDMYPSLRLILLVVIHESVFFLLDVYAFSLEINNAFILGFLEKLIV